jgi:hypothetical protein
MDAIRRVRPRYPSQCRHQRGIDWTPDEVVTAGDQNGIDRTDRRNAFSDSKSSSDRHRHVLAVHRRDLEPVVRAEPVGFGEDFGRSGGVQQLDAVEDNDHHRARWRTGTSHSHTLIVSVSVGKMADQP